MIGDDSTVLASPGSPTSTGKVPSFLHALDRGLRELGRLEQRDEAGVLGVQQRVDRDERPAHGLVARHVGARSQSVAFSTVTRSLVSGYGPGQCSDSSRTTTARPATARGRRGRRWPSGSTLPTAIERNRNLADPGSGEVEAGDVE